MRDIRVNYRKKRVPRNLTLGTLLSAYIKERDKRNLRRLIYAPPPKVRKQIGFIVRKNLSCHKKTPNPNKLLTNISMKRSIPPGKKLRNSPRIAAGSKLERLFCAY
jgi:hypothetical protein